MPKEKTSTYAPTKSETDKPVKSTVLVRNTSAKTGTTVSTAAAKTEKPAEKKTISRCWKRLMNMAREIRHAHTKAK
jgi:CxxC motif-containing protein